MLKTISSEKASAIRNNLLKTVFYFVPCYSISWLSVILSITFGDKNLTPTLAKFLRSWDADFYVALAQNWYPEGIATDPSLVPGKYFLYCFFPLFPATIKALHFIAPIPHEYLGLIICGLLGFISIYLLLTFAKLIKLSNFYTTILVVGIWFAPASDNWIRPYTEPLFLCLTLATFICLFKKNYIWAALFAGLLSTCRITGVLALAIVAIYLLIDKTARKSVLPWLCLLLSGAIFSGWYLYVYYHTSGVGGYSGVQEIGFGTHIDFGKVTLGQLAWVFFPENLGTAGISKYALVPYGTMLWITLCMVPFVISQYKRLSGLLPITIFGVISVLSVAIQSSGSTSSHLRHLMCGICLLLPVCYILNTRFNSRTTRIFCCAICLWWAIGSLLLNLYFMQIVVAP